MQDIQNEEQVTPTEGNRAICILGMHRSGTSAVARVLNLLGVYLGKQENIMPPGPDNPEGFWENTKIVEIHDRLFQTLGYSWDTTLPLPHEWWKFPEVKPFKEELKQLIIEEFSYCKLRGWKDPRTCILLPLWIELLKELKVDLSFVIVTRNPLEVADSLTRRNGFTADKGWAIWFLYMINALYWSQGYKRTLISYEDFMQDWKREIRRAITELSIPWKEDEENFTRQAGKFIKPQLRHHSRSVNEAFALLPKPIAELYELCLEKDEIKSAANSAKVNQLFTVYETISQISIFEQNLRSVIVQRDRELKTLQKDIQLLQRGLAEKDTELMLIRSSLGWRMIELYRRLADRLFPGGTKRRQLYELTSKSLKVLLTEGPFELAKKIKGWFKGRRELRNPRPTMIKKSLFRKVSSLTDRFEPFSFPANDQPKASIIIPVYNKWLYTYNCLRSIANNTSDVPYEVIVVDNASEDETGEWLDRIENLVVIKNNENEGFIKACNKGAGAARGEFLVFLNNDTVVLPGWLSALIGTLQGELSVGAVGAKLLYPDGRLQEAGGIIWNDASGWNYGRNDSPDKSKYNFVREVDYCSGACLAIKKEIFKRCNGFDERYYPAYFEDSDLCFAVRKLGYKVLYQPKAEIIHFEGITAGKEVSSGVKSFQVTNKPKFYEKWQSTLREKHWPPESNQVWRSRRHGKKPEVLMMDHYVPEWDKDSGSFYMRNMIEIFLKLGWNITFYPDNLTPLEPYTSQLEQIGVEVIYGQRNFDTFMRERRNQFDLALLRRPDFSFPKIDVIRKLSPGTRIVYDTSDLHFLREQRRAELEGNKAALLSSERYKAKELYLAKTADVTFVVTEYERRNLLELDPTLKVAVIPNIHPIPERQPPPFEDRRGIMFLGSYAHTPNVDGVTWFVTSVWPLIRKELPDIEFYIIGSNPNEEVKRLAKQPGVKVTGWVQDVGPWFDKCRLFVSPLRYGAGMKGKIGHAMSYGLPVVTTSIGAEGMELEDGKTAFIKDDPVEFARTVVMLYQSRDLWEQIAKNAVEHVRTNYTPEVVLECVARVLRDLGLSNYNNPSLKNRYTI